MYQELIEQMQPKPKFNLKWYQGEDLYSEGTIEDIILQMIAENNPEDYTEAIYERNCWSVYYHLTHVRKNLLNWYPFKKDSSVLEIGCGLGALTGLLCDTCKKVTAVELSERRAAAALLRCREKENLEIIVGNLNDIEFEEKFDYITLIGVLEYQGNYTETEHPYMDFLKKVKSLLKPDGRLLIAIENQYGLKYWCGAREDHTGIPFEGMNQYNLSKKKVRTFSKMELQELIKASGFQNIYFYYPMPDYKLPEVIYSEKQLPQNGNMLDMEYYYTDYRTLVAQESFLYKDIIKNHVFEFFSNSFLVECTEEGKTGEITFAKLNSARLPEYRLGTRFTEGGGVEKFPLQCGNGAAHIRQTYLNEMELSQKGLKMCRSCFREGKLISDYMKADLAEQAMLNACMEGKEDEVYQIWDRLYQEILRSSEPVSWEKNLLYGFPLGIEPDEERYGPVMKKGYLDMILRNAFLIENDWYWFDQEWALENIPAKYILYRGIKFFYYSYPEVEKNFPIERILSHYRVLGVQEEFSIIEKVFLQAIADQKHIAEKMEFYKSSMDACIHNIKKIMSME